MALDLGSIRVDFDARPVEEGVARSTQALQSLGSAARTQTAGWEAAMAKSASLFRESGSDMERAARETATRLTASLRATFERTQADIKEAQLRGFLTPQEAEQRGRAAAEAFNQGLVRVLDQQGAAGAFQGARGQQLFVALAGQARSLKEIEPAAQQATRGIGNLTRSMSSLAAAQLGVRAGLGPLVSTLGTLAVGSAVTLGVVAGLAAMTAGVRAVGRAAREEREKVQGFVDTLVLASRERSGQAEREREAALRRELRLAELSVSSQERAFLTPTLASRERLQEAKVALQEYLTGRAAALLRANEEELAEVKRVDGERTRLQQEALRREEQIAGSRLELARLLAQGENDILALRNLEIDQQQRRLLDLRVAARATGDDIARIEAQLVRLEAERPAALIERAFGQGITPRVTTGTFGPGLAMATSVPRFARPLGEDERAMRERLRQEEALIRSAGDLGLALVGAGHELGAFGRDVAEAAARMIGAAERFAVAAKQAQAAGGIGFGSLAQAGSTLGLIGAGLDLGRSLFGSLFGGGPSREERQAARAGVLDFADRINRNSLSPLNREIEELTARFNELRAEAIRTRQPFAEAAAAYFREMDRIRRVHADAAAAARGAFEVERLALLGDDAGARRLELALRNAAEAADFAARGFGFANDAMLHEVHGLRELALARELERAAIEEQVAAILKAADRRGLLFDLDAREARLAGNTLAEVEAQERARMTRALAEAEAALAAGELTEDLFTRISRILTGEFNAALAEAANQMTAAAEAAREQARAQEQAARAAGDDLDVRILRALGRDLEADTLQRQLQRQREVERFQAAGFGQELIDKLLEAFRLEELALGRTDDAARGRERGVIAQAQVRDVTGITEASAVTMTAHMFTIAVLNREQLTELRLIRQRLQGAPAQQVVAAPAAAPPSTASLLAAIDRGAGQTLALTNSAHGVRVTA